MPYYDVPVQETVVRNYIVSVSGASEWEAYGKSTCHCIDDEVHTLVSEETIRTIASRPPYEITVDPSGV